MVERLSDDDLDRLNGLLPWACFTVDGKGRRFGDAAWSGKREEPQPIPDRRIVPPGRAHSPPGQPPLAIGCFEGVHNPALCQPAGRVTAGDARLDNVVKTMVRCAFHGCHPEVFTCDIESPPTQAELAGVGADYMHHVGVLYHLRNPVRHVQAVGVIAARA